MSLIAILISLLLERTMTNLREHRQFGWFDTLTDRIMAWTTERGWQGPGIVLLIMAGPVLLTLVISSLLDNLLLGVFSLLFNTAVLFLCLGPRDLEQQVDSFLEAWSSEDEATARAAAGDILGEPLPEELPVLQQNLVERILIAGNERVLSPIFWFTVFVMLGAGPLGAVMYRLSCHLHERFGQQSDGMANAVRRLHGILGWVPAHLVALLFAMAGSFVEVIQLWRERTSLWLDDWQQSVTAIVIASGLGALQLQDMGAETDVSRDDIPQHVRSVMGLLSRTLVLLVALVAGLTLILF